MTWTLKKKYIKNLNVWDNLTKDERKLCSFIVEARGALKRKARASSESDSSSDSDSDSCSDSDSDSGSDSCSDSDSDSESESDSEVVRAFGAPRDVDMRPCKFIMTRGPRKGSACGFPADEEFCDNHEPKPKVKAKNPKAPQPKAKKPNVKKAKKSN